MEMRGAGVALEGLESRLLLYYTPSTTEDAVYDLVIDGINSGGPAIRAEAFSVGVSRPVSVVIGAGQEKRDLGPTTLTDMNLTLVSGRYSPALMQAAVDGVPLAHATLIARSPGDASREYERWTLDNVLITGYQTGASAGGTPYDSISLNYTNLGFQVTPRDMTGQAMAPIATGYDVTAAKPVGTAPGHGGQFFDPPRQLTLEFADGQVPITSFSWSLTRPPSEQAEVAEFSFQADGGVHSPALLANTVFAKPTEVILTSRDAAGRVDSRWVLGNVLTTSYGVSDAGGDGSPRSESFTLQAMNFERAYYEYDAKGGVSSTTQSGWDLITAHDYTTGSLDLGTGFGTFDAVAPDPRNAPVGALTLRFPERLASAPPRSHFALFRDGRPVALSGVSISTGDGGTTYQVGGLAALTAQAGRYTMNFFAADAGTTVSLETASEADIVQGDTVSWAMDTTFPTITAASAQPEAGSPLVVGVTFSEAVTGLSASDLKLTSDGSPAVSYQPAVVTWDAATRTARFTFAGPLPDGNYTAQMSDGAVSNLAGSSLAGGLALPTFVLAGDVNRDRVVNFDDLVVLAKNYNKTGATWGLGDLDGNGVVNFDDLLILAKAYNKSVPAAVPVLAIAPAMAPVSGTAAVLGEDKNGKGVFSTARVAKPAVKAKAVKVKAVEVKGVRHAKGR